MCGRLLIIYRSSFIIIKMAFTTKEFEWSDCSVVMLGKTITGIQSVEYSSKQEKEFVHGRGSLPLSIQSGNKTYDGSIELLRSEYDTLIAAAKTANPLYDIHDISFDVVVCYEKGGTSKVSSDTLIGVEFTDLEKAMKQGDKFEVIKLPIMFLRLVEKPAV
jgi:hypothetical protein